MCIGLHLVGRDSSVSTGTSTAGLNPDHVTEVRWWEHPDFGRLTALEAAELVAFAALDPALRSRGGIQASAKTLAGNVEFRVSIRALFRDEPAGRLLLPTLKMLWSASVSLNADPLPSKG